MFFFQILRPIFSLITYVCCIWIQLVLLLHLSDPLFFGIMFLPLDLFFLSIAMAELIGAVHLS